MQVPAPFEYERATSVDHAIGLLERLGERGPAGGRRPQPAADDEAAAGQPRVPHRHQRPARRARLHRGRADPDPDRGDDPAPRAARVRRAAPRLPDLPRRRAGDRRPGRAQPRHPRRLALPGRPVRGPVRRLHDARRQLRHPRQRAASGWCRMEDFHRGPVRDRRRRRPRCSPRCASRCGPAAPAPTRRWSGGPATGRSSSAGAAVWMDGGADRRRPGRAGRGRARTPPASRRSPRRCAARPPSEELYAEAGAIAAESCTPVTDTRGTADYKRHLADELTRRTLRRAVARITRARSAEHAGVDDRQRRARSPARSRAGCCSCTSCATTSA